MDKLQMMTAFLLKKTREKEKNGGREDELESAVECGTNLAHGLGIALNNAKMTAQTQNETDNSRVCSFSTREIFIKIRDD